MNCPMCGVPSSVNGPAHTCVVNLGTATFTPSQPPDFYKDMTGALSNECERLRAALKASELQVGDLQKTLWDIVTAFKRGTPIGHQFCECVKCAALYEAVRAIRVYESPGSPSQVAQKREPDGLGLGESRNLPYPKPISDDDAKKRVGES